MKTQNEEAITVNELAVESRSSPRAISKWLEIERVNYAARGKRKYFDAGHARRVVASRQPPTAIETREGDSDLAVLLKRLHDRAIIMQEVLRAIFDASVDLPERIIKDLGLTEEQGHKLHQILLPIWRNAVKRLPPEHQTPPEPAEEATA